MTTTLEELDNTSERIKTEVLKLRRALFPDGKPDYMSQEEWKEISSTD